MVGEIGEDVDLLQRADWLAVFFHNHALDFALHHAQQRIEYKIIDIHRNQIELSPTVHRFAAGGTGDNDVAEGRFGHQTDAAFVAHQRGFGAPLFHYFGGF